MSDTDTVIQPITAAQKKLWIESLRSGNFEQTKETLVEEIDNNGTLGYCCLGVLDKVCDLQSTEDGDLKHGDSYLSLPCSVQAVLIEFNDDEGRDFNWIADWVETNVKTVEDIL